MVGGLAANLFRLRLVVLCLLMFLAALGLLTTSVFSFPVAALVSLTVYTLAESRSFLDEAFEFFRDTGLPPGSYPDGRFTELPHTPRRAF